MSTVLLFISKLAYRPIPCCRYNWARKTDSLHEALKTFTSLHLHYTQAVLYVAGIRRGAEVEEKVEHRTLYTVNDV